MISEKIEHTHTHTHNNLGVYYCINTLSSKCLHFVAKTRFITVAV